MATFTDFLQTHPEVDGLSTGEKFYAEEIFNILNADGQIEKAIQASKNGKSALSASIDKIEEYVNEHRDSDFVLFDFNGNGDDNLKKIIDRNKRYIGKMQKFILEPFAYLPTDRQEKFNGKIFDSATCYDHIPN